MAEENAINTDDKDKKTTGTLDYSKWNNIEVSDDEDDTHPFIDTPSLYRWRHRARMERMENLDRKKNQLSKSFDELAEKKMADEMNVEEIEKAENELKLLKDEIDKEERLQPWNVDTLSKDSWDKTLMNYDSAKTTDENRELIDIRDEENNLDEFDSFVKKNYDFLEEFSLQNSFKNVQEIVRQNIMIVTSDHARTFISAYVTKLAANNTREIMNTACKQLLLIKYIFDMSQTMKIDRRDCATAVLNRLKVIFDSTDTNLLKQYQSDLENLQELYWKRGQTEEGRKSTLLAEQPGKLEKMYGNELDKRLEDIPTELLQLLDTGDVEVFYKKLSSYENGEGEKYMEILQDIGMIETEKLTEEQVRELMEEDGEKEKFMMNE
ncbi:hypothetical protein SNEBB_008796 [Seison nebaliae]|nr:hypothetical protein SNEBB_008796 [Seison nebaliae]